MDRSFLAVYLVLVEARRPRVALHDRLALGVAGDPFEVDEAARRPVLDEVDDPLRTTAAVVVDDPGRRGQPGGLVRPERRGDVLGPGKQRRHAAGVEDGLTRAVGAERVHGMGGVSEQRHPPERPARDRIAVAHRELEELPRGPDDLDGVDHRQLEGTVDLGHQLVGPPEAVPVLTPGRPPSPAPSLAATAQFSRLVSGVAVWRAIGESASLAFLIPPT